MVELVLAALCVVCTVVCLWFAHRTAKYAGQVKDQAASIAQLEVTNDVEELSRVVADLAKSARRDQMRRVRAASSSPASGPEGAPAEAPPELQLVGGGPAPGPTPSESKDELRRRLLAGRRG